MNGNNVNSNNVNGNNSSNNSNNNGSIISRNNVEHNELETINKSIDESSDESSYKSSDEENKNYVLEKKNYIKKLSKDYKLDTMSKCINMSFFETGSKWKEIFKMGTKMFKFIDKEKGNLNCNMELLIIILKDYYFGLSKYKNKKMIEARNELIGINSEYDIDDNFIKTGLIKAYYDLLSSGLSIMDITKKIEKYDGKIKKGSDYNQCIRKPIQKDNYIITETDIIVYCNAYKIPLILCSSKRKTDLNEYKFFKTINTIHPKYINNLDKCSQPDSIYHYFIRNINNVLTLIYNKDDYIKISNNSLHDNVTKIMNNNTNIENYFKDYENSFYIYKSIS